MSLRIEPVHDPAILATGVTLLDKALDPQAVRDFLAARDHHLLFAWLDEEAEPVGMISGVRMTHPDKGTEMFIYELGVADRARRRGVATALVRALAEIARQYGCYGMWVATEPDNTAAIATYRRVSGTGPEPSVIFAWDL